MQKAVNEDVLISRNAALVLKPFEKLIFLVKLEGGNIQLYLKWIPLYVLCHVLGHKCRTTI